MSLTRRLRRGAERRAIPFADSSKIPTWQEVSGGTSASGVWVTESDALGIPAVSAAVRLVSETIASLPLRVYTGVQAKKRVADESWQHDLLFERPCGDECSPFDFIADVAACIEVSANAFIRKVKVRRKVVALLVIDPARVRVGRTAGGVKRFEVFTGGKGRPEEFGTAEILHIRGWTPNGRDSGQSMIALHRSKLGSVVALDEWQGSVFRNSANLSGALRVPGDITNEQAEDLLAMWRSAYTGISNAGQIGLLKNGADWVQTGMSLEDAQFVESEKLSMLQAAHIFRLPPSFLLGSDKGTNPEHEALHLLNFSLMPRLRRIERGFKTDTDLFPEPDPYPLFDVSEFLRSDAKTRAEVQHKQVQSGVLLPDEARADEGRPPLDEVNPDLPKNIGKTPQIVPVGGSPFGVPDPTGVKEDEPEDE